MALANEWPLWAAIKMLISPARNRDFVLPALGVASGVALLVAHLQLWGQAYAAALEPTYLALLLLSLMALGLSAAAVLVLWLSEGQPQLGLVPVAAVGLVFFDWGLLLPELPAEAGGFVDYLSSDWGQMALWLGFWVGLFSLPQLGLLIQRSSAQTQRRSTVLLLLSVAAAIFVGCNGPALAAQLMPEQNIYTLLAIAGWLVSAFVLWRLPIAFLQFFAWVFIHLFYRIEARDLHHIPARGPVLLVCNHVSFIDSFVVGGTIKRPPRFVMDKGFYEVPVMNWIFRTAKAIPIAPAKKDPEMLARAYDQIAAELQAGEVVLVFPEGAITWDGEMIAFKEGVERILKRTPVRVVPIALRGLWGSWFSRSSGGTFKGLPRPWKKIQLRAGEPLAPEDASAAELQKRVQALRGDWQ